MTKMYKKESNKKEKEKLDNICEECKKENESVSQNLMMQGYKICDSCKICMSYIFCINFSTNQKTQKQDP